MYRGVMHNTAQGHFDGRRWRLSCLQMKAYRILPAAVNTIFHALSLKTRFRLCMFVFEAQKPHVAL